MSFVEAMHTYFRGEQNAMILVSVAGVLALIVSVYLLKVSGPGSVERGLLIPLLVLGVLFTTAGGFNAYNNGKRLTEMTEQYEQEPTIFLAQETARMEAVGKMWLPLKILWTALAILGLFLLMTKPSSTWVGVGLGLLLWGFAGHMIDGFASVRGDIYSENLSQAAPQ